MALAEVRELGMRPQPRPNPLVERRDRQRDTRDGYRAYKRKLWRDWQDRQIKRRVTYRDFIRDRQKAERTLRAEQQKDRLERQSLGPDGERLGERMQDHRQLQYEWFEKGTPGQRLRPDPLGRNRPG